MFNNEIIYNETDGFKKNNIILPNLSDEPKFRNLTPLKKNIFAKLFMGSLVRDIFLPEGFPNSVHSDYIPYQFWNAIQVFASTVMGTLTTHSVLKGVGVGESSATPLVAAITWILKDGTGCIGRIVFAWWQGSNLDSQSKRWRLFADILNDIAMSIELVVPYFIEFSSYILCLTTGMKAIVGVASGATRMALKQHQALKNNLADVAAKEGSQETFVNIVGSFYGIIILLYLHEQSYMYLFILLMVTHLFANYSAVKQLQMNSLNEDRLSLVIKDYILYREISNPKKINNLEPLLTFFNPARKMFGFKIEIGSSFEYVLKLGLMKNTDIRSLLELFASRKYLPVMDLKNRKIYLLLTKDATEEIIFRAFFHSSIYATIISKILGIKNEVLSSYSASPPSYPIMKILTFHFNYPEIQTKFLHHVSSDKNHSLLADIVSTIDEIVVKEYDMFIQLLKESDWLVKTNMLPVKPWRGWM